MDLRGARVLVTGGAGFVGVNLTRVLRGLGASPWCYDDFSTGELEDARAAGFEEIVHGDVRDLDTLTAAARDCSHVVHLAAQAGVPTSIADPLSDCDKNVRGTLNALLAARDVGATKFVLASSSAPLGDIVPPAHEDMVARPLSPYGASKLAGEAYCYAFAGSYGLPTLALRFTNVYGPFSYHKGSAVAAMCKRAVMGEPIVVHGDGTQTRDFVYVDDLCAGIARALASDDATGVLHLGSGVETSVKALAEGIAARFEDCHIVHEPSRAGDVPRSAADLTRARKVLGYEAPTDLRDGLDRTVAWFREAYA